MIDHVQIRVSSGRGGNGAVSGRREKFVPHGGPDGGDGGDGGDIYARCDRNVNTLLSFRYKRIYKAGNGSGGSGRKKHGRRGGDVEFVIPPGTEVWDDGAGSRIADLTAHGERVLIVQGGRGGRGNSRFTSSTNQFPLLAEEGDPGRELRLRLELKLLADVGIIGAPNAGKSSLLTAVSAARPKVADYPFTTLEPVLGVIEYENDGFVMVDIPGLIEGAHAGAGLGDEFLRHIERTRILVHVIDGNGSDPVEDYFRIRDELRLFDESLTAKPEIIAFNKLDIPGVDDAFELCRDELAGTAASVRSISAAGRIGLAELLYDVAEALSTAREEAQAEEGEVGQATVTQEATAGDVPVLRPAPADRRPKIRQTAPDRYEVIHRAATRFAGMVDLNNWGARVQFYDQLRRQGVIAALERAGITPGDTYVVGKHELEWE